MSRRKNIRSKQQFDASHVLEKAGDIKGAIKGYEKSVKTDPANTHAWNRQMVLYRRSKTKLREVQLIQTAIAAYQKSVETGQQEWLKENQSKADSSRELAQVLGLLEPTGLPKTGDTIIEKWQTRLYLLQYRINNARKKKAPVKKKTAGPAKPVKVAPLKPSKNSTAAKPKQKK